MHDTQLTTLFFLTRIRIRILTVFVAPLRHQTKRGWREAKPDAHVRQRDTAYRRHFVMHHDSEFEVNGKCTREPVGSSGRLVAWIHGLCGEGLDSPPRLKLGSGGVGRLSGIAARSVFLFYGTVGGVYVYAMSEVGWGEEGEE